MKKMLSLIATMGWLFFVGCGGEDGVVVTQAEYDQIQNGMSYAQVVAVIGSDSDRNSDSSQDTPQSAEVVYFWTNPDISSWIAVRFRNGIVYGKQNYGDPLP